MRGGETILVTSRGEPVATIQPADRMIADREAAKQVLLERHRAQPAQNLNVTWTRDELYDD